MWSKGLLRDTSRVSAKLEGASLYIYLLSQKIGPEIRLYPALKQGEQALRSPELFPWPKEHRQIVCTCAPHLTGRGGHRVQPPWAHIRASHWRERIPWTWVASEEDYYVARKPLLYQLGEFYFPFGMGLLVSLSEYFIWYFWEPVRSNFTYS